MIDKCWIGRSFPKLVVDVEKGQLRFFAKAAGEKNPVYTDEVAALEAGYRSLPAPPTFTFSLSLAAPDPFAKYTSLGIDLKYLLHGRQRFEYFAPICAGDTITLQSTVVDVCEKKGGALVFVEEEAVATNQDDETVAKFLNTLIVRNQGQFSDNH